MDVAAQPHHVLVVAFPAQGHINPSLQFAKRLASTGLEVTFATSVTAVRRMASTTTPKGLSIAAFSDGQVDNGCGPEPGIEFEQYLEDMRHYGSRTISELIISSAKTGHPFSHVVHSILLPWAAKVAREHGLPSTLLWSQPAAVFGIYYHYFHGYGYEIEKNSNDPTVSLKLPGLPPFASRDLPSFFHPTNEYAFALQIMKEHLQILDEETHPEVLINTFDALECEALKSSNDRYKLVGVGPLIPSAFVDGKDPHDTSFGGDLFKGSSNYMEWLSSKPESSVIYIAFGSLSELSKPQVEEIESALLDTGHPFLWVIRGNAAGEHTSCAKEKLEQQGMIVSWCSQVEVLCHPSVGCFFTHCGWNSTFEGLAAGVPAVAFPQWTDQLTNAKLVEDVWKTGVRVSANKEGIVEREEIKRCLDLVMEGGQRGEEMRRNAEKWKELGRQALQEGGSSDRSLKAFVDQIRENSSMVKVGQT